MVVATKFEFEFDENVLAPLTSIVLNMNHLVRFSNRMLAYAICFLLDIEMS